MSSGVSSATAAAVTTVERPERLEGPGEIRICPIYTEDDYEMALEEIGTLLEEEPQPGTEAYARLDVIATLVEAYEKNHHPVPPPDPIEEILHYMERTGMNQTQLASVMGVTRGRASEILNRERALSIQMIRALHRELGISADVLIASGSAAEDKAAEEEAVASAAAAVLAEAQSPQQATALTKALREYAGQAAKMTIGLKKLIDGSGPGAQPVRAWAVAGKSKGKKGSPATAKAVGASQTGQPARTGKTQEGPGRKPGRKTGKKFGGRRSHVITTPGTKMSG